MMANPGNTGHRYKMSKILGADVKDSKVTVRLTCGHDYSYEPMWGSPEDSARWFNEHVGKRTRCDVCPQNIADGESVRIVKK